MLLADVVGPEGRVTGIDVNGEILESEDLRSGTGCVMTCSPVAPYRSFRP